MKKPPSPTQSRVTQLRALMRQYDYDAYIVPSEDAHLSEYVASCDERRMYMSNFTGSAGVVLVTHEQAYLWTDGRYFVQAAKELDSSVYRLMRMNEDPPLEQYLKRELRDSVKRVAVDSRTVSISGVNRMDMSKPELVVVPPSEPNLVDLVWQKETDESMKRPAVPCNPVRVHELKYAGVSVPDKIKHVRECMTKNKASMLVISGLDEVAWLLNLRGSDVDYNPVFLAYVIITMNETTLCTDSSRFLPGVNEHLKESNVSVKPYDSIYTEINDGILSLNSKKAKNDTNESNDNGENGAEQANINMPNIWVDIAASNYAIQDTIDKCSISCNIISKQSPIALAKAKKNAVELQGMRDCHERDAVALCKFLAWLEDQIVNKQASITEYDASEKLDEFRGEQALFISASFPTISSSGSNGAIIHYRPFPDKCSVIKQDEMYLVDSGGQYYDGTTDVTRTVHMGQPNAWEKECFTRVLKGHIALDALVFPKGTTGHLLDAFARQALWKIGKDYKHGTGHGVGCCLNVHEGPHVISFKPQALETPLEIGFLTSNEPGYYEEGKFGIRIESVCAVSKASMKKEDDEGETEGDEEGAGRTTFMTLDHLTMVPIQKELMELDILSKDDVKWLNDYHEEIWVKLSGALENDALTSNWLRRNTQPLVAT